jgi:hypothetical protein
LEKESIEFNVLPVADLSATNTTSDAVSEWPGKRSPGSCASVTDATLSAFCLKLTNNFNVLHDFGKVTKQASKISHSTLASITITLILSFCKIS